MKKRDPLAVPVFDASGREGVCVGLQHNIICRRPQHSGPSAEFVDVRHEDCARNRLDQIIVCACIQYAGNDGRIVEGRKHQDGNVVEGAHRFADLPTVHAGHH